jgi:phage major head subunit gpT-like protein
VDAVETVALATYGKIYGLSRQAIINDDLGALTDAPRAHGEAAARKIGDVAYAQLTSNPVMGDGVPLFHENHANVSSVAGAPSVVTVAEAEKLMLLQKGLKDKQRLNLRPRFIIVPVALKTVAQVFLKSERYEDADAGATRVNPFAGALELVSDARLDAVSSTAWYLAGPSDKTVRVFFLRGQRAPYLEAREGWTVDGVQWKVRIDCAAKALDWKALVYNAGA